MRDEFIRPCRITGKKNPAAFIGDLQRQRNVSGLVRYSERKDLNALYARRFFWVQNLKGEGRAFGRTFAASVHHLAKFHHPFASVRRSRDRDGGSGRMLIEIFDEKKWNPTEVIAV